MLKLIMRRDTCTVLISLFLCCPVQVQARCQGADHPANIEAAGPTLSMQHSLLSVFGLYSWVACDITTSINWDGQATLYGESIAYPPTALPPNKLTPRLCYHSIVETSGFGERAYGFLGPTEIAIYLKPRGEYWNQQRTWSNISAVFVFVPEHPRGGRGGAQIEQRWNKYCEDAQAFYESAYTGPAFNSVGYMVFRGGGGMTSWGHQTIIKANPPFDFNFRPPSTGTGNGPLIIN